jgi:hypothetical protein
MRAKSYNPVNNCVECYCRRHRAFGGLRVFPVCEAVATALMCVFVCVCVCVCVCARAPHTHTHAHAHACIGGNRSACANATIPRDTFFIFTTRRLPRTLTRLHWRACVLARTCEGRGRHRGGFARQCVCGPQAKQRPGVNIRNTRRREGEGNGGKGRVGQGPASRDLRSARWRAWARHSPPSCTPGWWPVLASKCRLCRPG